MEYQDPLICWAIANAKNLGLAITQLNWPSHIASLEIHSFSCEISVRNRKSKGFGKGKTQELAIKKAIIETIERYLLNEFNFKTSNGIAGHTDYSLTQKNAIDELIERDLFLCHFFTKTPFKRIPEIHYIEKYQKLITWSEWSKIKFTLYYLGQTGCLGLIDGRNANNPFGYTVTSTFSDSLDNSIENTMSNLVQRGFYYHSHQNSLDNISLDEFVKLENPNFVQHGLLALNIEYANSISFLFEGNTGIVGPALRDSSITCVPIQSSDPLLKNIPASFARAYCEDAQNLFLGMPTKDILNFSRLSSFSNREQNMHTILNKPHPMD